MRMKVVVWNMERKAENWDVLSGWTDLADADITLLCEAPRPPSGVRAVGHWSTKGLDCRYPGPDCTKKKWSTAVVSPPRHSLEKIRNARVDRYYKKPLPFEPSRPGTWTARLVDIHGVNVTAISLYGLMDEKSDASVHRSLSVLSPILDHEVYGRLLLLGGDLNILAGRPRRAHLDRHQVVLARIRAYGLIDCLEAMRPPGVLDGCPCGQSEECSHTWTYRSRRRDRSHIRYQDDYLFASPALAEDDRLLSCYALPFNDESPSDHAPIVGTFEV